MTTCGRQRGRRVSRTEEETYTESSQGLAALSCRNSRGYIALYTFALGAIADSQSVADILSCPLILAHHESGIVSAKVESR